MADALHRVVLDEQRGEEQRSGQRGRVERWRLEAALVLLMQGAAPPWPGTLAHLVSGGGAGMLGAFAFLAGKVLEKRSGKRLPVVVWDPKRSVWRRGVTQGAARRDKATNKVVLDVKVTGGGLIPAAYLPAHPPLRTSPLHRPLLTSPPPSSAMSRWVCSSRATCRRSRCSCAARAARARCSLTRRARARRSWWRRCSTPAAASSRRMTSATPPPPPWSLSPSPPPPPSQVQHRPPPRRAGGARLRRAPPPRGGRLGQRQQPRRPHPVGPLPTGHSRRRHPTSPSHAATSSPTHPRAPHPSTLAPPPPLGRAPPSSTSRR